MTAEEIIRANCFTAFEQRMAAAPAEFAAPAGDGQWLPFLAAQLGRTAMVQALVERCAAADFDRCDAQGRGLLHYAALADVPELARYLVERGGFSPVAGDTFGVTPYALAHAHAPQVERYFAAVIGAPWERLYQNPVVRGARPDPSVLAVGGDYYMVNSSFVLFPCIPVAHSRDLVHWRTIGYAITDPALARLENLAPGHGYWAPDLSYYRGKYYIVATLRKNGAGPGVRVQMLTWADRPEGPYAPPVFIEEDGIDPSLFTDDDGKRYLVINRGARIFEIGEYGERLSETKLLYYGELRTKSEGPHLLKKDGWYYLFMAEGGTGANHRVTAARAPSLFGVYEPSPYNPVMTANPRQPFLQRCGHGMPVRTPAGDWYLLYLCARKPYGISLLGRETALDPLVWTADGWPLANGGRGPSVLQKCPLPQLAPAAAEPGLEPGDPAQNWLTVRGGAENAFARQGARLRLQASNTLAAPRPCALLRRQTEFDFTEQVYLQPALCLGGEAGLAGYYDETSYYTFALTRRGSGYFLRGAERQRGALAERFCVPCPAEQGYLRVRAEGLRRVCLWSADGADYTEVGAFENVSYLSDEGGPGKRFTGALHGIFAASESGSTASALFAGYSASDF